ncbi:unnamed protein product [Danaus chrysippus]|uniref:(African queen) hypothetical protein n=1 Tax=Danaus chrysippus TaxID=151541 RepID=A0A8J2MI08_9NEOP|nr:unnamed protein product [Danaus chrysippus]
MIAGMKKVTPRFVRETPKSCTELMNLSFWHRSNGNHLGNGLVAWEPGSASPRSSGAAAGVLTWRASGRGASTLLRHASTRACPDHDASPTTPRPEHPAAPPARTPHSYRRHPPCQNSAQRAPDLTL